MKAAIVFIALWLAAAFGLSYAGWFERFTAAGLFGVGTLISSSGCLIIHSFSEKFRGFLRARSVRRLTRLQILRLYGSLALLLAGLDILPALFAVPTGVIDIALALTAFPVASRLVSAEGKPRPGFVAWHFAGLVGLAISALTAILTSSPHSPFVSNGITSQPMTLFPMSLVPVFIGPLVLILHLQVLLVVFGNRRAPRSVNGQ